MPAFGDAGQLFDPFVYLGYLAANTKTIALGTASIILPLRHPAHVAKSAVSLDQLSGGRFILGVASGDRPQEYPAFSQDIMARGELFRQSLAYIREMANEFPTFDNHFGTLRGDADMLPKPTGNKLPILITGGSGQPPDFTSHHGDGWMIYPRPPSLQAMIIQDYRERLKLAGRPDQPVLQPFHVDLAEDDNELPTKIHLGSRLGMTHLLEYLHTLEEIGVNHVMFNIRFGQTKVETTLKRLADDVLPRFA